MYRWSYRVCAYAALMRDEYPPFRLDTGGTDGTETLVPLEGATLAGDRLKLAYERATITHAPQVRDGDNLSAEEADRLYDYYALPQPQA